MEERANLIFRKFHNTARVGKSDVSDKVVEILSDPASRFEDVQPFVSGAGGAELLKTGDLSKGIFWASMVQGLIHDIPTVEELVERIVSEADDIAKSRLKAFFG